MIGQVMSWAYKRYVRYIAAGVLLGCLVVNVTLQLGAGLRYICEENCVEMMMSSRLSPYNRFVLAYLRSHMLEAGAPHGSYKPPHDILHPPWGKLGKWSQQYEFLQDYFGSRYKNQSISAKYVEIGAQDGEFMSLTAFLETKKNFRGLLVEPNPSEYRKLRAKKRSAMSVNACVSPTAITTKMKLWVRRQQGNLPPLLQRVQDGSNRLLNYVAEEDAPLGTTHTVQCFALPTLVQAAFHSPLVDLLVLSTHSGELEIITQLDPDQISFRVIVVVTPLLDKEDVANLKQAMARMNLELVSSSTNIHIFVVKGELNIVSTFV